MTMDALPDMVSVDGAEYKIRAGHKVILSIFKMLNDPEIADRDRMMLLRHMFFVDTAPWDAMGVFALFVRRGGEAAASDGERDFDYEQDAEEIYSAFMQVYGIDLISTDLHWWRFSALLTGVFACDNALTNKIRLRHMDDSKDKQKSALERSKRAAALTNAISRSEAARTEELAERLKNGLPISDLLRR